MELFYDNYESINKNKDIKASKNVKFLNLLNKFIIELKNKNVLGNLEYKNI